VCEIIALNSSFESTPSWFESRLSNVGADEVEDVEGDEVEGAGGVEVEGIDDCCAIAAAGRVNKKKRGARRRSCIASS
jgi:hypothetical protein